MKRYDIAQVRTGGIMVDSEDGDYVLHDEAAPAIAALEAFVKQYHACGPNSDFGRIFQRTYTQARSALAGTAVAADCAVCSVPHAKHGSYPTCATHPYTPDANCQHVIGAACVGAECRSGCVRGRGTY